MIDNYYNVAEWKGCDAHKDLGRAINEIIESIKANQNAKDHDGGEGMPGATIYIPSGDWHLKTTAVIDISFLHIEGAGHGFTSSSIRFNVPKGEQGTLTELWPGGSRVMAEVESKAGDEASGAAFLVRRGGSPRISSVEFTGFCIDGLHFIDDGSGMENPENTYTNGKTGILVDSENDSLRINEMGFVYLEHGVVIKKADALSVHDNFIAECGSCLDLLEWGQASKVTDNLMGAGYKGHTIYAEHFGGLLVMGNNIFPRGESSVRFNGVMRSSITANRLHSFYPGAVILEGSSSENLVSSNHILRDNEPWGPMLEYNNGLNDDYGALVIDGDRNTVTANHISLSLKDSMMHPAGVTPIAIRVAGGSGNYIAANHVVATRADETERNDSCFSSQVEALLSVARAKERTVTAVFVSENRE